MKGSNLLRHDNMGNTYVAHDGSIKLSSIVRKVGQEALAKARQDSFEHLVSEVSYCLGLNNSNVEKALSVIGENIESKISQALAKPVSDGNVTVFNNVRKQKTELSTQQPVFEVSSVRSSIRVLDLKYILRDSMSNAIDPKRSFNNRSDSDGVLKYVIRNPLRVKTVVEEAMLRQGTMGISWCISEVNLSSANNSTLERGETPNAIEIKCFNMRANQEEFKRHNIGLSYRVHETKFGKCKAPESTGQKEVRVM